MGASSLPWLRSSILMADDGGVEVNVSTEASIQTDDAPDSPQTASTTLVSMFQTNQVAILCERFITWTKARSGAAVYITGGNYGNCLNLALLFGARRHLLIGFDMSDAGGVHWYGRNTWSGGNNPGKSNFRRWIAAFEGAASQLRAIGAEVINTAPESALRCFPFKTIEQALADWDGARLFDSGTDAAPLRMGGLRPA
jgi:hypothetical protein